MRINQLTFTRFLAAIAIVIYHNDGSAFPFNEESVNKFVKVSNVLVSYFFTLSGFILFISSKPGISIKYFYLNRFSRIYPLFLFALIIFLGLALNTSPPLISLTFDQTFFSVFGIQAWLPQYAMVHNYPAWSLSVEIFFYLTFPILIYYIGKKSLSYNLIACMVIWLLSLVVHIYMVSYQFEKNFTLYFPLFHFNCFFMGMVTGILYKEHLSKLQQLKQFIILAFTILSSLCVYGILTSNEVIITYYHNGLFAPLFCLFILLLSMSKGRIKKTLSHPSLEYLGEISYGIYILQVPFGILFQGLNNKLFNLHGSTGFYLYVLFLITCAAMAYEVIEKPCRKFIRDRWIVKKPAARVVPLYNFLPAKIKKQPQEEVEVNDIQTARRMKSK